MGASVSLMSAFLSLTGEGIRWIGACISLMTAFVSFMIAFINLAHTVMSVAIAVIRAMVARSSERNAFMKAKRPVMASDDAVNQRMIALMSLNGPLWSWIALA
jgi:hypothetical protein